MQILANTLRINQEAVVAINTEISALEQTISTSNDPAEIARLLMEIAKQIPETYRLRREALQAQYDAGEITLSALNTGLAQLNIAEAAEIERNSDAQLENLFSEHNADIALIANTVNIVSTSIRNSTDPEQISQLLVDLRAAIMEKYRLQREFLQAQLDAEEITIKQYEGRIGNLNIQESAQLGSADTLALTETQDLTRVQSPTRSVFRSGGGGQRAVDPAQAAAAAAERQRRADEAAGSSLLGTDVRSARFELTRSTGESDFEVDRQALITAINAVHAAEDARITDTMGSEIELAALRAKNDLARDIGIANATNLENTFTTQRIKDEMDVADAAAEAAADQIQAQMDAAEAAAEAAQDQIEAQQKIAEAQQRTADQAAAEAERQRGRESNAAAGLLQTGVGQARFDLGLSGSEGEFEANRIALINGDKCLL